MTRSHARLLPILVAAIVLASSAFAQTIVAGDGLTETTFISPLGIDPPKDIQARIAAAPPCATPDQAGCRENISLSAFRVVVTLPAGISDMLAASGRQLLIAIESEAASGIATEQTPAEFPRAQLRQMRPDGTPEARPVMIPLKNLLSDLPLEERRKLNWQSGSNRFESPWIVAIADPRASIDYAWPAGADKRALGCHNCERPLNLRGKSEAEGVYEIFTNGDSISVRAELVAPGASIFSGTPYAYLGERGRFETRVRTLRADLTRAASDPAGVLQPPTAGSMSEQSVSTHNGEVERSATDLAVRSRGLDFVVSRYYSSAIAHLGPFGRNFDSPVFARLRPLPDGAVEYFDGTGRKDRFTPNRELTAYDPPPGVFLRMRRGPDGFVVLYPDNTRFFFNDSGRLTKITDRNTTKADGSDGNAMHFGYDERGRLSVVVDPAGREHHLRYYEPDESGGFPGCVKEIEDSDGRIVRYRYDASARLTDVEGPDPASASSRSPHTKYTWKSVPAAGGLEERIFVSGQLAREIDGEGRTIDTISYDPVRRWAAESVTSGGGTWTFTPLPAGIKVTDPNAHARDYALDAAGRVTALVEPGGATTRWSYDAEGRLASVTRPLGDGVAYAYDAPAAGGTDRRSMVNVRTITETPREGSVESAAGLTRVTSIEYSAANLPSKITAADGATTTIDRDDRGNPRTVTDAAGVATAYAFDERGLLKSVNDPRTGTASYGYETLDPARVGYLKSITTMSGTTRYETDGRGNATKVIDPLGRETAHTVNKLDQVEEEIRGASKTTMAFDAAGNLTSRSVLTGTAPGDTPIYSTTIYATDELGRLRSLSDDGATTTCTYDPAGNLETTQAPAVPLVTYGYDDRDRLLTVTEGARTTGYTYDENGSQKSVTNAHGKTTAFTLNGFGERIADTDPLGITTAQLLDAGGRPVDVRVIKTTATGGKTLLRWTQREYDPLGRVRKEIRKLFTTPIPIPATSEPAGATDVVTETIYDDAARRVTTIDPRGMRTVAESDEMGRPLRTTDAVGNQVALTYDGSGNKASETRIDKRPDGTTETFVTNFFYDNQNRLIVVIDNSDPARPLTTQYRYDTRGNRTDEIDAEGQTTKSDYDLRGNRIRETDPNGGVTEFTYDDAVRLRTTKDPNGNVTKWTYGDDGNLESEERADAVRWTYTWDEDGNRKTVTDANGTVVTWHYDDADRLTGKTIAKAPSVVGPASVAYTLDDLGRTVGTETDEGVKTFAAFDSLDRPLSDAQQIGDGPMRTIERGFDLSGNAVGVRYPTGLAIQREFDPLNRIAAIFDGDPAKPVVTYRDSGSRQIAKEYANGIAEAWRYDPNRRLREIEDLAGDAVVRHVVYDRSPVGNKKSILRPDLGKAWTYRYNANSWITNETIERTDTQVTTLLQSTDYDIDKTLNFRSITKTVQTPETATTTTTGTVINNRNQYTSFGGETLGYDRNGNLTSWRGMNLQYDFENHLKKATLPDGTVVENRYDANGRKLEERLTFAGVTRATESVQDDQSMIEEYVNGNAARRYVRGRGIDEFARAERSTRSDGVFDQTLYPAQDELGNVERLTDASGTTLERYEYEGYGIFRLFDSANLERATSASGWGWLFQGHKTGESPNAIDFRARTLWPELARFGQEDPVGTADSSNRYQALLGDWLLNVDPRGEDTILILYGEGYLSTEDIGEEHDVGRNFQLAAETRARELQPTVDRMNQNLRAQGRRGTELWYIAGPLKVSLREDFIREVNGRRGSGPIRELHVFSHGWQGGLNFGGANLQNWRFRNFMISDVSRINRNAFTKNAQANFLGCNTANTSEGVYLQQVFGTKKPFSQVFSETVGVGVRAYACSSHFEMRGKNVYQVPDRKTGSTSFP